RFAGKRAMISVTVGTTAETYAFDGRSGDIDLLLWPVHFTLAYVGFGVLAPFVAYGVEAGLRYSHGLEIQYPLAPVWRGHAARLQRLAESPTIPFNRMAEWGANGRIRPEAPAYSPFVRHRRELDLT